MATEKKLIDAEPICQECGLEGCYNCQLCKVGNVPTVDAVEVVHGRWKFVDIDGWWFNKCSICGDFTPNHDGSPPGWNYCPNCGAKMDGDGNV